MKIEDLRGKIFFKKDDAGDLSELLYDPILKISIHQDREDFVLGLSSLVFLMTWDNIIISKKTRFEILEIMIRFAFYGEREWRGLGSAFFHAIIFSSEAGNPFGIKNFIDLDSNKILQWKEAFDELGIQTNFF